jgi:hypothetical protein
MRTFAWILTFCLTQALLLVEKATAFSLTRSVPSLIAGPMSTSATSTSALDMAKVPATNNKEDEDFMKWARAARYATDQDEVVELPRPLGLILNQDASGNVYVETVAPRGNAARSGKVCIYFSYIHLEDTSLFRRNIVCCWFFPVSHNKSCKF